MIRGASILLATAALALLAAPGAASRSMETGFFDPLFSSPDPQERALWLDRARTAGAEVVRLDLRWNLVAPLQPAQPADPADPAYRWGAVDGPVADATARGLAVILTIYGAPAWAEQGRRPQSVPPGVWKPDPVALGAFAEAAARRYPAVRAWQIWNEPNLSVHLAPQWERRRPFAPARYRAMMSAAYRGIKAVDPSNRVGTAGTAPYGDSSPGGRRIMPVRFWREVLCLREDRLQAAGCRDPAHFDAIAHHPYGVRGPRSHALNADDAAVPDLARLARVVRAAVRHRTVRPVARKQLWVTEMSWDSRPPDPYGVPASRQAAWLADALFELWRQRVDVVTWFRVRDQPPVPSYGATNQSGVYLLSGAPKPSLRAWLFPLSCRRVPGGLRVWGRVPAPGEVSLERRMGEDWRSVRTLTAGPTRVFELRVSGDAAVRASATGQTSRACR